jgi:hypothetical protein
VIATFTVLGLVKYGVTLDFHLGDVPVPLKIIGVIERIVKAEFHIAEQVYFFAFSAFIFDLHRPYLGIGIDWDEIRRRYLQTIECAFDNRIAQTVSAFVIVEFGSDGFEARIPRLFAVADINIPARIILWDGVVMIPGEASQAGVAVKAVTSRGIGDYA